ncbi:hypothetical protein B0H10DRAFT_1964145 [Mycena sp. CBHHK59/15]|nr:hypothetical protein B0H10DRAFT_1964145 [Mycena sp. CBHHK59/15]
MWADWTNKKKSHKLLQEYFVQFTSTSPHASSSELFAALGEDWFEPLWSTSQNSTNSDVLMKKQATRNGGGRAQRNEAIEQWASDKAQLHGDGPWPGVTEGTAAIPCFAKGTWRCNVGMILRLAEPVPWSPVAPAMTQMEAE